MAEVIYEERFDEGEIEFYHSDETRPFLVVYADTLKIYDDRVEVYSRDYPTPIITVYEYDYWREN